MKRLLIALSLIGVINVHAQWRQSNGPFGGIIRTLLADGHRLFAGTDGGGIFLSADRGSSWHSKSTGLPPNQTINTLIRAEGGLFAGTLNGVFRSTDDGQNWSGANSGLAHPEINALAGVSVFGSPRILLAGTHGLGIYRSFDDGESWNPANDGLPSDAHVVAVLEVGGVFFAATNDTVYRSTNGGDEWKSASSGVNSTYITSLGAIRVDQQLRIFAGTGNGVFMTLDEGATWIQSNIDLEDTLVVRLATHGTDIYALTPSGPYYSPVFGEAWRRINGGKAKTLTYGFAVMPDETGPPVLFAGTYGGGILRATDLGPTWHEANNGLTASRVVSLSAEMPGPVIFGGTTKALFRSSDGEYWSPSGISGTEVTSLIRDTNDLLAGTYASGIFRSTDFGETWEKSDEGLTHTGVVSLLRMGQDLFAATYGGGIFRSEDDGRTWNEKSNGIWPMALDLESHGDLLFAATDFGGIYVSSDRGEEWRQLDLWAWYIPSLISYGGKIFAGTDFGIYVSEDSGATWTKLLDDVTGTALLSVGPHLFAGTLTGVVHSADSGRTWRGISEGLANPAVLSLSTHAGRLLAGTIGGGVWHRPLSEIITSVDRTGENRPGIFTLEQNYPNPFNPSTVISYHLSVSARVNLKIFDILGKEVASLVDADQKPGAYRIEWNASGFPSGTYFSLLEADGEREVKRLVLLK